MREKDIAFETAATVLILGPTGSGKTRLAREIHQGGVRKNKPFVVINLASLHEGTLESELFGHERGAFTGAAQKRVGKLELADGGTVFLDEIGELSPRLQARLLEFIQTRRLSPLGASQEKVLDVRIIAATHRDLEREIAVGAFREDLYHRLRVIEIRTRALMEREGEFDEIVHSVLEELCREHGRPLRKISEEFAAEIESYGWPGNVRELRNVLEYAVLASRSSELRRADLPSWFFENLGKQDTWGRCASGLNKKSLNPSQRGDSLGVIETYAERNYTKAVAAFEREFFSKMLRRCGGRVGLTAQECGISRSTLLRRLKMHQVSLENEIP